MHLAPTSTGCYDRHTMSEELAKQLELLLEAARSHELSDAEKEQQRRSFAYGNAKIENPRITREMIDQEAEALNRGE
jgi:hypothetical protein